MNPTSNDCEALGRGELTVIGRIRSASNATFLCEAQLGDLTVHCVYKPVAGERPLWDFPDGTLAAREYAARVVSEALGWNVVPPTLLREGPAGPGMVQLWCEPDPDQDPVDLLPEGPVPAGPLHVGVRIDKRYVNPRGLFGLPPRAVLLPCCEG